ncbi:MAG: hypothetical protein RLZZ271_104 [Pseudomonadota bacterium]
MISRRALLATPVAAALSCQSLTGHAAKPETRSRDAVYVAQLFDTSLAHQDVSRDFMIGSRCAWQEMQQAAPKAQVGIRHRAIEVDGSPRQLESALETLLGDPSCIALSGTVGQSTARWVAEALEHQPPGQTPLVQIAPWLHDMKTTASSIKTFASLDAQISHALKNLSVVGLKEVGVVFASAQEQQFFDVVLKRLSTQHKLKVQVYVAQQGFYQLGLQLPQETPAVLLFMAGTPELAQFSKGAGKNNRHRYAIGMADINSQTLQQMGLGRNVPVVITQVVPIVTAALPVVRDYRNALAKFFDEPPSPLSLSGYISARITHKLLGQHGVTTRNQVGALAKNPWSLDIGGYVVDYDGQQAGKAFVTQSMVASDGRLIG